MTNSQNTPMENSELFCAYYERTSDAILIIENGVFTNCNQAAMKMLRATDKNQILSLSPSKISPERQLDGRLSSEKGEEVIRAALAGTDSYRFEWTHRRMDGEDFPAEVFFTPIADGTRQIIHAIIRDITKRKQSESEIKYLASFVETANEAIMSVTMKGEIVAWNAAAERLFGYSKEDIIGKPVVTLSPPEVMDQARIFLQKLGRGESIPPAETIRLAKDGRRVNVLISATPIKNEAGEVVRFNGVMSDITARKLAEQSTHESEERFRTIYDNTTVGLYRTTPDGRILMLNPAGVRMLGFESFEEIAARNLEEAGFEVEDPRAEFREQLDRDGVINGLESIWVRKDGTDIYVRESAKAIRDENGKILYYDGSFEDITDRKQAETELLRLKSAVEQSGDGIAITDMDGNLLYANPAWAEMHGYSLEEIKGKHLSIFHTEEQIKNEVIPFNDAVMAFGKSTGEIGHVRKDGSTFPALMTSTVRLDEKGRRVGLIGTARDVSESKKSEARLQESEKSLRSIVEALPIGMYFYRIEEDDRLVLVGANSTADQLTDTQNRLLFGKTIEEAFPMLAETEIPTRYREAAKNGTAWSTEQVAYQEGEINGAFEVYAFPTTPNNMAVAFLNITDRLKTLAQVQKSEERFRTIADFTYDWEYWLAPDGKYNYISPSCERISGYKPTDFESDLELFAKIVAPESQEEWEEHARIYHGAHSFEVGEVNLKITTSEGETRWIGHVCQAVHDEKGNWQGRRANNRDITKRIQLEHEVQESLKRRELQVEVSTQVSQYIAAAADMGDLYKRVVSQVKEQFNYYHTQILRYDTAENAVVLIAGYGETGAKMLAGGHRLPMGIGLIGTAAATGETILRPDLSDDPDWQPNPLLPDTKGEIAVPIKLGDTILGVLDVQSSTANALGADDQLALEGLCGQIASAIESTRLRQETNERIEEINRLYRAMSRESWQAYRQTEDLPTGFMFDQTGIVPIQEQTEQLKNLLFHPITVPGGETVGTLAIPEDPSHPLSPEDRILVQQISDQIALALESARLFSQTQTALAQTEKLSSAGLRFAQAVDLQELVQIATETLGIPQINRAILETFTYNSENKVENMDVVANWWNGSSNEPTKVGMRYTAETLPLMQLFLSPSPIFIKDTFKDERIDSVSMEIVKYRNIRAVAVLPLYLGAQQIGVLLLESETPYNFTQDEVRLFTAMGPQISTVLENRRQFERAQKQAEREARLNIISQKIQGATTVDAVLQIAARELGHALGAPMTIAQLSMKDKK